MKTSEQSVSEVIKSIKDASLKGQLAIKSGVEKTAESIAADIQKLMTEANYYKGQIIKLNNEWKEMTKEVEILEGKRQEFREKEQKINEKAEKVDKQEKELVDLHQVLYNKGRLLKEKEEKLLQKVAQLEGRERSVAGIKKSLG